jgi:hypothetical protein
MPKWEYMTLIVDNRFWKFGDAAKWGVKFSDGQKLIGLDAILSHYDALGWEYVDSVPEIVSRALGFSYRIDRMTLIFRRPVAASEKE